MSCLVLCNTNNLAVPGSMYVLVLACMPARVMRTCRLPRSRQGNAVEAATREQFCACRPPKHEYDWPALKNKLKYCTSWKLFLWFISSASVSSHLSLQRKLSSLICLLHLPRNSHKLTYCNYLQLWPLNTFRVSIDIPTWNCVPSLLLLATIDAKRVFLS